MDKHPSKLIILVCLLISVVIAYFALRPKSQPSGNSPIPHPVPVAQAAQPMAVGSPDGKLTLTVTKYTENGGNTAYTFLVTDEAKGVQKQIFTKTETAGTTLSIPDNTFSSDNKYVFLKESVGTEAKYFVLSTAVSQDAPIANVSDLFTAKYQDYVISETTGWAGPTLLVVNTNKTDGSLGPSFWLDVGRNSFIRLSTRFN
jgi:hypothetical protein